jgi:hypothetical protein
MSHACTVCNYEPVPDGDGVECPHCHRLQYGRVCPHCGQNAPTMIRGLKVYCSGCNNVRGPLAGGMPLNIVGQPQKIGSTLTGVAGWALLIVSLLLAAALYGIGAWLFTVTVGLVAAALVGLVGGGAGALLLLGSRKLKSQGNTAVSHAREGAIFALAANRGGMLTATEVATALNIQVAEADAILTGMAREANRVGVEVDGAGVIHYVFNEVRVRGAANTSARPAGNVRVDPTQRGTPGVRVDAGTGAGAGADPVKTQVDREWQQMQERRRRAGDS